MTLYTPTRVLMRELRVHTDTEVVSHVTGGQFIRGHLFGRLLLRLPPKYTN